jgi:hypothetical protein
MPLEKKMENLRLAGVVGSEPGNLAVAGGRAEFALRSGRRARYSSPIGG